MAEAGHEDTQRSPKRRMLEPVPNGLSIGSNNVQVQSSATPDSHWSPNNFKNEHLSGQTPNGTTNTPPTVVLPGKKDVHANGSSTAHGAPNTVASRPPTSDGQEEEAAVLSEPRMLVDPKGRLCKYHTSLYAVPHRISSWITP